MAKNIRLDSKQFSSHFRRISLRVGRYLDDDAPRIVGTEAVNHFKKSFDDEGFTDASLEEWKPSKRTKSNSVWYGFQYQARTRPPSNHPRRRKAKGPYRARKSNPITNYSPAATKRRTLTGQTGDLKESIEYRRRGDKVIVGSNLPYAKVHNEGETIRVFGGKSVTVPKRQFIGDSIKLTAKIKHELNKDIKRFLNKH